MRDYDFGNFIYTLRMEKKLSQSKLGALVGVSNKAVSKWENGGSKPSMDTLKQLSEIFDVTVEELLAGRRNPAGNDTIKPAPDNEADRDGAVNTRQTGDAESTGTYNKGRIDLYDEEQRRQAEERWREEIRRQEQERIEEEKRLREEVRRKEEERIKEEQRKREEERRQEEIRKKKAELEAKQEQEAREKEQAARKVKKSLIIPGIIIGAIFVLFSISILSVEISGDAFLLILLQLLFFALIYMMVVQVIWRSEPVTTIFHSFIDAPQFVFGLIFELSLDGCLFFIVAKIIMWVISALLAIAFFFLVVAVAMIVAPFTFPFQLNKAIKTPEKMNFMFGSKFRK